MIVLNMINNHQTEPFFVRPSSFIFVVFVFLSILLILEQLLPNKLEVLLHPLKLLMQ